MLEKRYQIHLQNHYDASSREVQKKEIKVLQKHKSKKNGEVFPNQICLENIMEYSRFMTWFENEVQKIAKKLWNQHFIIKLTLSQLYFRETILFLENIKDFSKRITIEFVGENIPSNHIKSHFSMQEQEAFFIGKLRMLKKWKFIISKHIEGCSVEQTLAFTPCIHEIKYMMNQKAKLEENIIELHMFIDFWEYWAAHKKLKFVVQVKEGDFITKSLMHKKVHVQFENNSDIQTIL
ncbi:hypothetical protein [Listeria booriae]|uniref:Uncharacterized protein n=1 Tax=Listeria booriae TaxID=1552123 RepID=A0A842A2A8_9LIST|nr:hypothetical protein [Listeria booriae]MBC1574241.1 hypothetical protein [Listeria booriae]MBC2241507.1 hypothetical protein [Listeria booriae]